MKKAGQRMRRGKITSRLTSETLRNQLQHNGSFKVTEIQHIFGQIRLGVNKVNFNMKL